ncbi:hypothetical protein [Glycomyces sp. YM15]|uniref:hypothetical protein n=1 Tax=Glycomyces sp. YM15 TaxID=2800446 RepID=UPI001964AD6A|nr:hypothetical protein [Glycomyces sp. YM15]
MRFALWLVGIAAILTLGHLLGPQSDLQAIAPHESANDSSHDTESEQDHPESPSHDHGAHACGLAMLPDTEPAAPVDATADPLAADCASPAAPVADTVDARDRSPTDPVSELQVNRV